MNSPRQQVRDAIVYACPELLELKQYTFDKSGFVYFQGKMISVPPHIEFWLEKLIQTGFSIGKVEEFFERGESKLRITEKEPTIRLSHVLRAIKKATESDGDSWWYVDKYGDLGRMDKAGFSLATWPPSDNLDDCNDKTIEVLHSILCHKTFESMT